MPSSPLTKKKREREREREFGCYVLFLMLMEVGGKFISPWNISGPSQRQCSIVLNKEEDWVLSENIKYNWKKKKKTDDGSSQPWLAVKLEHPCQMLLLLAIISSIGLPIAQWHKTSRVFYFFILWEPSARLSLQMKQVPIQNFTHLAARLQRHLTPASFACPPASTLQTIIQHQFILPPRLFVLRILDFLLFDFCGKTSNYSLSQFFRRMLQRRFVLKLQKCCVD